MIPDPSGPRGLSRRRLLLAGGATLLSGCTAASATELSAATKGPVPGADPLAAYRLPADADLATWAQHVPPERLGAGPRMLALSGGGEDGAFGAGLLYGWSRSGARPVFDIVSGVSTGALIAPFAFLGAGHDRTLHDMFLRHDADDLMTFRTLGLVQGDALYDTAPLARLIETYTPPRILRAIAKRHAEGARLFVVTTNLDTSQAVVWDMGAIARAGETELFRAVLRASSAIPGMFPPVRIAYRRDGGHHLETHVDGGVYMPFLAIPPAACAPGIDALRGGHLYVIVNNTLDPVPQEVQRSALGVSQQALTAMIRASARSELNATRMAARQLGLELSSASVAADAGIVWDPSDRFSASYMRALYDYGRRRAEAPDFWDAA